MLKTCRMAPLLLFFLALCAPRVLSGTEKIIFDTDPGYFNDDCQALVMLLHSPEKVEVLGITVVPGNTWPRQGAEDISQTLKLLNRAEIPVFLGAQAPLVHTAEMAKAAAERWGPFEYTGAFARPPPPGDTGSAFEKGAVDFLIETIEKHPGEVAVLAIGPMTNLAIALRLRPEIATKIKRLVYMGGNVHVPGNSSPAAEFNFWFDPEAAQIVLRSRIPQKLMFGLDICNRARLTKAHFDEIVAVKTPVTDLYRQVAGERFPGFLKKPGAVSHVWDQLAAGYLLDPAFVTASERAYLDVDSAFGRNYGATIPLDRKLAPQATPVEVMLDLDFPRFFALYKRLLQKQ